MISLKQSLITTAVLAVISQASQANTSLDLFSQLFAPSIIFTGDNICNGGLCPMNPASPYDVGGPLVIGFAGVGTLDIEDGGVVNSTQGFVGGLPGSNGTVTVRGSGSQWNNSDTLQVGSNGSTLLIEDGGLVTNTSSFIGDVAGDGAVIVTGTGSQWNNSATLNVGSSNTGILVIEDGGIVTSSNGVIGGAFSASDGGVAVSGSGSQWNNSNLLQVGSLGTGILFIIDGGVVTSSNGKIGTFAGSNGTVVVTGAGSHWNNSLNLEVGSSGTGTLLIEDGGVVVAPVATVLSQTSSGVGTLNLNGTAGNRGVLQTTELLRGVGPTASAHFDGGILRASANSVNFIASFLPGELVLQSGGLFIDSNGFDITTNSVFTGTGGIIKEGSGILTLSGDSSGLSGISTVNAGVLVVNGQLGGDLLVAQGGRLKGNGVIGNTTIEGIIAPGNSIGTLTVNGNYTQTANSIYEVEINPQGQSDLINVTGIANIAGTVEVLKEAGSYSANTQYTILHANGGINGTYDNLTQLMPFLNLGLNYDGNNVYLVILRSALHFADLAITPNQVATAIAAESLGSGNPVFDAVASLSNAQQAQQAFENLSGEIHASTLGVLIEESRYLRYAVLNRLQQALSDPDSMFVDKFGKHTMNTQSGWTLWSEGYGAWGDLDGNNNAAKVDRSSSGIFLGADRTFGESIRVGVLGGYSRSDFDVDARSSSASSTNYHLGVYGGTRLNQWDFHVGGAYTWNDIDMTRNVIFPGFNNHLKSNFDAHSGQLFAEAGYNLTLKRIAIEPFAGIAYVNVDNEHWGEIGGPAALQGKGHDDVFYSTVGLREATTLFEGGDGYTVSEKVLLGWQHAYNGLTPQITQQFVSGGLPFLISGAPIAGDSLLIDAGVNWENQTKNLNLRLSYIGQLADKVTDNGVAGVVSWKFS